MSVAKIFASSHIITQRCHHCRCCCSAIMNAEPPIPPILAAVPPTDGRDMLQLIPEELLKKILQYSDLPSLVLLAATSRAYRRFVFRDCPYLWTDIDFGKVPLAERLTDECLAALLTNVNARKVTTILSLMGCAAVRGRGLEPLCESRKLQQIELRRTREEVETIGETGLDDDFVVGVLLSMAPINANVPPGDGNGLKIIRIRRQYESKNYFESFSTPICRFISTLDEAIANQVRENGEVCKNCNCALAEKMEYFHCTAATCFCSKCKTYRCGERGCDIVLSCEVCMEHFCNDCNFVFCCSECDKFFCDDCRYMGGCDSDQCEVMFYCEKCRLTLVCDLCHLKSGCEECRLVVNCESCEKHCCEECRSVRICDVCDRALCTECDPVQHCASCENEHCKACAEEGCHVQQQDNKRNLSSEQDGNEPSKRARM